MISVIVPVYNEEENIAPLVREIAAAARAAPIGEILYVDDGSTDGTLAALKAAQADHPQLRIIIHSRRSGQSAAFWSGVSAASDELVAFLDGDGQNDPADITRLYETYNKNRSRYPRLMVAGQRQKRQDNLIRRLSSRAANKIRSSILQDKTRDTGCSLKLMARDDYLSLPYFNHMHRFIPALMMREGVQIFHADVSHRPRQRGTSKYGFFNRLWVGIVDLAGVRWLIGRRRPGDLTYTEVA